MIYRQWNDIFESVKDARKDVWLQRWSGLDGSQRSEWALEPDYGAFVDVSGNLHCGLHAAGATLENTGVQELKLAPEVDQLRFSDDAHVYFLDWGAQTSSWKALFALWDEWENDGRVLACGPVQVPFSLATAWKAPAFVVLRGQAETQLLVCQEIGSASAEASQLPQANKAPVSFLARAQALRDSQIPAAASAYAYAASSEAPELPMLPFTLESLNQRDHVWPMGVESLAPRVAVTASGS
jgi:hypothetical protein